MFSTDVGQPYTLDFLQGLAQALGAARQEPETPLVYAPAEDISTAPPAVPEPEPPATPQVPAIFQGETPPGLVAPAQPAVQQPPSTPQQQPAADELERKFPPLDPDMGQLVERVAHEEGVDPAALRALARAESSGNLDAVSKKGAVGLFQLTPQAVKDVGMDPKEVLGNPELEARAAARYLKRLQADYGAKTPEEVFAAYNGGPGQVIGKSPEEWPEESRGHAERVKSLMERELVAGTTEGAAPSQATGEAPSTEEPSGAAEGAQPTAEPASEEEPGETLVDERGEPVPEEEVEENPLQAAKDIVPDEEEGELPPGVNKEEFERYMKGVLEAAELSPSQRLGIAILAIQHPEMAMQMLSQAHAGRQAAVRTGLQLLREMMIGRRMEKKQEGLLFRQQVQEFHRRHRELLDQMAKDGIPVDTEGLPEIPADIQTPEELEAAEKALQQWTARYSQGKHEYELRERKAATLLKATDITRKGGVGSSVITSLYPEWEKDPELRDHVLRLREEEKRNEQMAEAEVRRVEATIDANRKTIERTDAQIAQIQEQIRRGRVDSARLVDETAGHIAAQLRQLENTKAAYEMAYHETWSPRARMIYRDAISDIDSTILRLQSRLQELSYLRDAALSDRMPGGHPPEAVLDPGEAYRRLQGQVALEADRWTPPGAPKGTTLRFFIENGLQGGNAELINQYGADVVGFVYQKALEITQDPRLAAMITQRWMDETATGGGWISTTFGSALSGEEIRQQLSPYIGVQPQAQPPQAQPAPAQ